MSSALQNDLARVGGTDDFPALVMKIKKIAKAVYGIYKGLIEDPAAALPPENKENTP